MHVHFSCFWLLPELMLCLLNRSTVNGFNNEKLLVVSVGRAGGRVHTHNDLCTGSHVRTQECKVCVCV